MKKHIYDFIDFVKESISLLVKGNAYMVIGIGGILIACLWTSATLVLYNFSIYLILICNVTIIVMVFILAYFTYKIAELYNH